MLSRSWSRLVIVAALCLPPATSAHATPRLAMRLGQDCLLCHQNPSGGGMRSEYASQYLLPERLVMKSSDGEPEEESFPVNPRIGDNVLVGLDVRTAHLLKEDRDAGNNFLQMQGAVHLTVELSAFASVQVQQEMAQGAARAVEIYGIAFGLPASGYVRAGRFVPAFGWKLDDHRAFTRREFVFLPPFPPQSDTGLEIGFLPGPLSLQLSITNGEFSSARDQNDELAWTARGEFRRDFPGGHAAIGASYARHRGIRRGGAGAVGEDVTALGPLAGVRVGPLTWLGEFDWTDRDVAGGGGAVPTSFTTFTTSQELSWEVVQGIDLVAVYDFHDVDVDRASGAVARIGGAAEAMPRTWLGLHAGIYRYEVEDGPDLAPRAGPQDEATESILMVHFLY